MSKSFYPAKLLLLGEHSVLKGSQALAMPLERFGGTWQQTDNKKLQLDLPKFVQYLSSLVRTQKLSLNTEGLTDALEQGIYFDSNIPRGYGAGSSGALVAAIYDTFCENKTTDLLELKTLLGMMESYFHGSSSGFDPLICYLQQPVLIKKDKSIQTIALPQNDIKLFLIDTQIPRKGEHLIKLFSERFDTSQYQHLLQESLIPDIDEAITAYLSNLPDLLFNAIHNISLFQYRYYTEGIPLAFKNVWLEGLNSSTYKLKLCGSGGGGFILGVCKNIEETQETLFKLGFSIIPVRS